MMTSKSFFASPASAVPCQHSLSPTVFFGNFVLPLSAFVISGVIVAVAPCWVSSGSSYLASAGAAGSFGAPVDAVGGVSVDAGAAVVAGVVGAGGVVGVSGVAGGVVFPPQAKSVAAALKRMRALVFTLQR